MENSGLIGKIKSYYILKGIFDYLPDNLRQLQLFVYSNFYKNKFDLKLIDYKTKYLERIGFIIGRYLQIDEVHYKKDRLAENYKKFLARKKLNKEEFEKIIFEVLENKRVTDLNTKSKIKDKSGNLICIDSPLFDLVSKTSDYENDYSIYISQNHIDKYSLKADYTKFFDNLNKSNVNNSSIYFYFLNKPAIEYLKDFHIDFSKIKRLSLVQDEYEENNNFNDDMIFFETLFSFNNIQDNLTYLKIHFQPQKFYQVDNQYMESLNELKSLKYLYLHSLNFDNTFRFTLSNLVLLNLRENEIKNLNILENADLKELKELDLSYNSISNIDLLGKLKLEKLEKLNLGWNELSDKLNVFESDNFKNLKELDLSQTCTSDIRILAKASFEKIEVLIFKYNQISDIDILGKVYFPKLKELDLSHNKIKDISVFEKVEFGQLEKLSIGYNQKLNLQILEDAKFKRIKISTK